MDNYIELKNTIINKYQKAQGIKNGENDYLLSIKRRDVWDNLENLKDSDIKDVIFKFLNKWQCRIKVTSNVITNIHQALKKSSKYFISVKNENLESLNFNKRIKINGMTFKIEDIIIKIFGNLCDINTGRRKFGATATSKVMHMVNPYFFMMFDDKIRKEYGCFANAEGYVNFMWRMQKLCRSIIDSYSKEFRVSESSAKNKICGFCHNNWVLDKEYATLPKLIDEFNYTKYTLNL